MSIIFLSYTLSSSTPSYGNGTSLLVTQEKDLQSGDSCNTQIWHLPNHLGTHIDAPKHFASNGISIEKYASDFWISNRPYYIELPKVKAKEIITQQYIEPFNIPGDIDLLLIKTGFGAQRQTTAYSKENPGFAPELADYLRKNYVELKMIGFDVISLSSYTARETGRKAHKRFLDYKNPILLIEDMDLTALGKDVVLNRVVVSPLRIEGSDAAPCTVFAEIGN